MTKKSATEQKLIVMVGLPGSGKSSDSIDIVNNNNNTHIISSDDIRVELTGTRSDQSKNAEVFKIFHSRIRECLMNGESVIADATNLTLKSRKAILDIATGMNVTKLARIMTKPYHECVLDNFKRGEDAVPYDVMKRMVRKFQIPILEEGFDFISFHKKLSIYESKYMENEREEEASQITKRKIAEYLDMMEGKNQYNSHHKNDLDIHCYATAFKFIKVRTTKGDDIDDAYIHGALIHDIGKLFTQEFDDLDGEAHYLNHANVGAYFVMSSIYDNDWVSDTTMHKMCFIINYHMLAYKYENSVDINSKMIRTFGNYKYQMLLDFNKADKEHDDIDISRFMKFKYNLIKNI